MLDRLIHALVATENQAADDLLLEALQLGNEQEQAAVLAVLIQRQTLRGLGGVIMQFRTLPDSLKLAVLQDIGTFHPALREYGRSDEVDRRLASMKLIALGHQGKLAFVLSENLHSPDPLLAKAAIEALVALARWVASETRNLQKIAEPPPPASAGTPPARPEPRALGGVYRALLEQRPEIEQAVTRALDVYHGVHAQDLLRAGLLLCDSPASRSLAIVNTARHGAQNHMVRRLQQPPASEHVDAFLLGASHGGLRTHFGAIFALINESPVLDALLRRTHWLKDQQLQACMHQVTRGVWWSETDLRGDIERRTPADSAKIAHWLFVSGAPDEVQDQRMLQLLARAGNDLAARVRLLRLAGQRPRGASIQLLRAMLTDPDPRLARMAVREIVRRRPPDFENLLLPLLASAGESVRRVIARSVGQITFEQFWQRFARLDRATRRQAGRAMLKILPDAPQRLSRRLMAGPLPQRLQALLVVQELDLARPLQPLIVQLCADPDAKIRSKAVHLLGELAPDGIEVLMDRVLNDPDSRVRANAIEVLEAQGKATYLSLLAQRARGASNRERANAIKALHRMKVGSAATQLQSMLQDDRPEHRISALWALRQTGLWQLLYEVGRLAKTDQNLRVRRYALGVLRGVADLLHPPQSNVG